MRMVKVLLLFVCIISIFNLLIGFKRINPLIDIISILAVIIIPLYFSVSGLRKLDKEGTLIEGIGIQLFNPSYFSTFIRRIKYSLKTAKKSPLRDNRTSKYLDPNEFFVNKEKKY